VNIVDGTGTCSDCNGFGSTCWWHGQDWVSCTEKCYENNWISECSTCQSGRYGAGVCQVCAGDEYGEEDCEECENGIIYDTTMVTCTKCKGAGCK